MLKPEGVFVSIEQASLCNKSSVTVDQSASEADFIKHLSFFGDLLYIRRIRNCNLSRMTQIALRFAPYYPFKVFVGRLSKLETKLALNISDAELTNSPYYDVIVKVKRNGKRA